MTSDNATPSARDEIIALCKRLGQAHADKDADAIVACYAADAVIYDLAPPLGRRGMRRDAIAEWLATWDGPITIDGTDADLIVGDDIAHTTALNRMRGHQDGADREVWFRTTMCFGKRDGRWRIVHDHSSVPFYMDGSLRAAVDLKPSIR